MYNRAYHEEKQMMAEFERRLKGPKASRQQMLKAAARKKRRDEAMTNAYHSRAESWLSRTSNEIESGKIAQPALLGPSYKTKNHAHHHRFRDRVPEKELGPMRVSANHYVAERDRIELNRTGYLDAMLLEEYQQPNPLPSHAKYSMRTRKPERELHQPLKFSHNSNEPERILASVEQNKMLETHGQYDRTMQSSDCPAVSSIRLGETTAPHYREYRPDKWVGGAMRLNFHEPNTHPHDYLDKPNDEVGKWTEYTGRIGSLARQRRQKREVDPTRMFHHVTTSGQVVTGPDFRPWATLPADFSHSRAFTTEHRSFHRTVGHYAHAYKAAGDDGLPSLNSSFGRHKQREISSRKVIDKVIAAQR